jgi:pimeloyl-ACP methyl ester carboxylesterase
MSAINSLKDNLPGVPETLRDIRGIQPDADRILMAGHSNGGQGAWYWATHFPDLALAGNYFSFFFLSLLISSVWMTG